MIGFSYSTSLNMYSTLRSTTVPTVNNTSLVVRKPDFFIYAKTKMQISFAVTAKLISVFVFATYIVQSLYFLNTKFQASSHLLELYSPVCVGTGRKPRRPFFFHNEAHTILDDIMIYWLGSI